VAQFRPPLTGLPWKAEQMRRLLRDNFHQSVPWWPDFEWAYNNCPDEMYTKVIEKLLSRDGHFEGGVWELFLWKMFYEAGAEVRYEINVSNLGKSCDFEIIFPGGEPIFVEATNISHDPKSILTKWHEEDLRTALANIAHAPGYYISARIDKASASAPNHGEIAEQVEKWIFDLAGNPSDLIEDLTISDSAGWQITCSPHPLPEGSAFAFTGFVTFPDDAIRYRTALENKLKKFEKHSGYAVVIAVSLNSEWWRSDSFDRFSALIARPAISINKDTFEATPSLTDPWTGLYNETYTRGVSAVLFGSGGFPGFSSNAPLDLWLNYTADLALDENTFPIARIYHRVTEDRFYKLDRDGSGKWEPSTIP
jgi:hypothetical protein